MDAGSESSATPGQSTPDAPGTPETAGCTIGTGTGGIMKGEPVPGRQLAQVQQIARDLKGLIEQGNGNTQRAHDLVSVLNRLLAKVGGS